MAGAINSKNKFLIESNVLEWNIRISCNTFSNNRDKGPLRPFILVITVIDLLLHDYFLQATHWNLLKKMMIGSLKKRYEFLCLN